MAKFIAMEEIILNDHNKQEYPPMHSAEHILNQTMLRMFGCERSKSSHIERKKSKCDYILKEAPNPVEIAEIESRVNEVIRQNLPITVAFVNHSDVPASIDLSKLPEDSSETLRLVFIGNYDTCACIGQHVSNTSEIGTFRIISTDYTEGKLRIRFKLES
jgi:misacylated tRNA(Ala) deacylase